jgi:predicted DNA-binding transcriptional regulator AlpA
MTSGNRQPQDRLERIARLASLPEGAVLSTKDAATYWGVAVSTWERMRAASETPPAIRLTARTLGYRKRELDACLDARTEQTASKKMLPSTKMTDAVRGASAGAVPLAT